MLIRKNTSYRSSFKRRVRRFGLIASCVLVLLYSGKLTAQRAEDTAGTSPAVGPAGGTPAGADTRGRSIGPGKVRFSMSEDGRWKEFVPAWAGGRSLISGGGLFVLSGDENGVTRWAVRDPAFNAGRCFEGIRGGLRAPMPNPDDDGDGRVDEDRLDGLDNDGDGFVDEDFAAVGDEMTVSDYSSSAMADGPSLAFHEECYAWSLPNIDGLVIINLRVRNTGATSLQDVRIGAYMHKTGSFTFLRRSVEARSARQAPSIPHTDALVCVEDNGTSMAMMMFPIPRARNGKGTWEGGYRYGKAPGDAERDEALLAEILRNVEGTHETRLERDDAPVVDAGGSAVAGDATVYGISPNMGPLDPGSEVEITVALLSAPEERLLESALVNAHDTYVGDGENRYLPPAVAMTPRILWGSYETIDDGETGVLVSIDPVGGVAIGPERISFLSGIDAGDMETRDSPASGSQLIIRGSFAESISGSGERLVLKGRLDSGEFFEALLSAEDEPTSPYSQPQRDAAAYWRAPGKLSEELLKGSPNPFRESTTIIYNIPSDIEQQDGTRLRSNSPLATSVKVYNVMGRLVSVLVDEQLSPGTYATQWQAVDELGNPVASGVYYVKLQIEKKNITKRLILLK
jgi:hypothetical protein